MQTFEWRVYKYENGREIKLGTEIFPALDEQGKLITADSVHDILVKQKKYGPRQINVMLNADQWDEFSDLSALIAKESA